MTIKCHKAIFPFLAKINTEYFVRGAFCILKSEILKADI